MLRWSFLLLLMCAAASTAEEPVSWQGYQIHYTTFPSTIIPPAVAAAHGLTRAPDRMITNITVRRNNKPVRADVSGNSRNLLNQLFTLTFTEVTEPGAIYYLASQIANERETLIFDLKIRPLAESQSYALSFKRDYRY